jgi:hypothetical protein
MTTPHSLLYVGHVVVSDEWKDFLLSEQKMQVVLVSLSINERLFCLYPF